MTEPFRFRDCACPGSPHPNGDTVTFRLRLDFDAALEALQRIFDGPADSRRAMKVYLLRGPEAWNLLDEDGEPVDLTPEALEELPFADQYEIAEAADTIYGSQVLSPLERRMKRLSGNGPTSSTSRRRKGSSSSRPTPLRPSSGPSSDPSPTTS